jgi:hypothetical protein
VLRTLHRYFVYRLNAIQKNFFVFKDYSLRRDG